MLDNVGVRDSFYLKHTTIGTPGQSLLELEAIVNQLQGQLKF